MREAINGSLKEKVETAARLAALDVIQIAKQTGTKVVIWEDGQIKHVPPEAFDTSAWLTELPRSLE